MLDADENRKATDIEQKSRLHLYEPFFDTVSQKWITLSCSYYSLIDPFSRKIQIDSKTYNTSVISCVLMDLTKLLDYKLAVNNTKVLNPPLPNQTLLPITNSYMIAADHQNRILYMPKFLTSNYNFTSLFAPDLVRYTGFSSEGRIKELNDLDQNQNKFSNFTATIASDPLDPSLIDSVQIHTRSILVSAKTKKNAKPEEIVPSHYIRSLIYFNMEDLTASKSLIVNNIAAAQYQITFLALIVIIIICAVVICISFQ